MNHEERIQEAGHLALRISRRFPRDYAPNDPEMRYRTVCYSRATTGPTPDNFYESNQLAQLCIRYQDSCLIVPYKHAKVYFCGTPEQLEVIHNALLFDQLTQ